MFLNFSSPTTTDKIINSEEVSATTSEHFSQLDDDSTKVLFKVGSLSSLNTDEQFQSTNSSSIGIHKNNLKLKELKPIYDKDSSQHFNKDYSPERDLEDLLSIVEPCQDASKESSEVDSGAASDSADTSSAQLHLISLTESELTANEDISSNVS